MANLKSRTEMVPVEVQYYEVTHSELLNIRKALLGGNAVANNTEFLKEVANLLQRHGETDFANYARQRMGIIKSGLEQIDFIMNSATVTTDAKT